MIKTLIKNWWLLALRGILAALFSVMAFLMRSSAETFTLREFATRGMVAFLGILALAAGACTIAAGIWRFTEGKWWVLVLDGLAISAAGLIIILSDRITFGMITYLLVGLALTIGVVELAAARMLRRHMPDEWFLALGGLASIGFALAFLVTKPEQPASILVWLGAYSGFSAICMLGLALRLRSLQVSIHRLAGSEPSSS